MKVVLPYPPSANRYWRTFRGRAVLSAEAKAYKKQVAAILAAAGHQPLTGPVAYTAHVYRPLKSGDLDNRLKVLSDALTGFAWLDDKQVVELHAYRHDDKHNPRVEVEVESRAPLEGNISIGPPDDEDDVLAFVAVDASQEAMAQRQREQTAAVVPPPRRTMRP